MVITLGHVPPQGLKDGGRNRGQARLSTLGFGAQGLDATPSA